MIDDEIKLPHYRVKINILIYGLFSHNLHDSARYQNLSKRIDKAFGVSKILASRHIEALKMLVQFNCKCLISATECPS